MRNLLALFAIVLTLFACQNEPKDYVSLSGKITNPHDNNTLRIFQGKDYEKIITVNEDGTFSDTLKVEAGDYSFKYGDEYGSLYLKNNTVSSFTLDYEDFDNTIAYEGDDADINNFIIKFYLLGGESFPADLFNDGKKEDLDKAINNYKTGYENLKLQYATVDSLHLANTGNDIPKTIRSVERYFNSKLALREAFPKGSPSPVFENYENFKGGTTSLSDLKGKYVYVDIWATWCGPCKREIPSLKVVESNYHGKNIEFVSISVDDGRGYKEKTIEASKDGWKKMVAEKELGGIQLFSDKAWQSDFVQGYKITGIPRFLLIDPDGNIVTADAPRPSNPKLVELFEELEIK
ncbi:MAG: TlpA family protein disulfide reductase [Flavobacteriaceae bacterium]|nr:TlpA family protein disulfide reductase [Flavobacteriaceae bacterium]